MEVVGFATQDFSYSKGDTMKVANMDVFTQSTCNAKLEKKLEKNKECKITTVVFTLVYLINVQDGIKCAGWKIGQNLRVLKI